MLEIQLLWFLIRSSPSIRGSSITDLVKFIRGISYSTCFLLRLFFLQSSILFCALYEYTVTFLQLQRCCMVNDHECSLVSRMSCANDKIRLQHWPLQRFILPPGSYNSQCVHQFRIVRTRRGTNWQFKLNLDAIWWKRVVHINKTICNVSS